jgi:arsenite methyltransferase
MAGKSKQQIRQAVKEHYAAAVKSQSPCCPPNALQLEAQWATHTAGYGPGELKNLPDSVTSFGCGNPLNFTDVREGDVVLDLGCGTGLDLILAARKVGPLGRAIGLDMTPTMIDVCRKNLALAQVTNAEVRLGEMEKMPVADSEVDWIISNCVINLSPEKDKVMAEAFRVLKPGGRIMVSDIVTIDLPEAYRESIAAWVDCIAGAVGEDEYLQLVRAAGFTDVKIVDRMVYSAASLRTFTGSACCCGSSPEKVGSDLPERLDGRIASIKLSARKPG